MLSSIVGFILGTLSSVLASVLVWLYLFLFRRKKTRNLLGVWIQKCFDKNTSNYKVTAFEFCILPTSHEYKIIGNEYDLFGNVKSHWESVSVKIEFGSGKIFCIYQRALSRSSHHQRDGFCVLRMSPRREITDGYYVDSEEDGTASLVDFHCMRIRQIRGFEEIESLHDINRNKKRIDREFLRLLTEKYMRYQ